MNKKEQLERIAKEVSNATMFKDTNGEVYRITVTIVDEGIFYAHKDSTEDAGNDTIFTFKYVLKHPDTSLLFLKEKSISDLLKKG